MASVSSGNDGKRHSSRWPRRENLCSSALAVECAACSMSLKYLAAIRQRSSALGVAPINIMETDICPCPLHDIRWFGTANQRGTGPEEIVTKRDEVPSCGKLLVGCAKKPAIVPADFWGNHFGFGRVFGLCRLFALPQRSEWSGCYHAGCIGSFLWR